MQNRNEQLWLALWQRIGAQGDPHKVYADLVAKYSEPHRAYHALGHIEHCLNEFKQVSHLTANPDAIEFAIWYHDAFYNTKAKDNEEKSAVDAMKSAKNILLPVSFGQSVANLIVVTKHSTIPGGKDARFLVDIDLSILGQSEDRFNEYERQIRKEYEWVSKDAFVAGRSAILKSFLERPTIYLTQFFRDKYEAQARLNIARSLAQLCT